MTRQIRKGVTLQIDDGGIVDCYTDCVVVPTTSALEWDATVERELTMKAGRSVVAAARAKAPLDVGEAVVTRGGGMLASFIIHLALPRASELRDLADDARRDILERAVGNSLLRCAELAVPSIGFPNLGRCLGLPAVESARLMLTALHHTLSDEYPLDEIHIVIPDAGDRSAFTEALYGARA